MNYINKKRKNLSRLFIGMLVVVVVFLSLVGYASIEIQDLVAQSKAYQQDSVEEFLEVNLLAQRDLIRTIENDWERYNKNDTQGFIDYSLKSISESSVENVVIAFYHKDKLYQGFQVEAYKALDFLNNLNLKTHRKYKVASLDTGKKVSEETPFRKGNRFYYYTTELKKDFVVLVGFKENVMYNQFISSLDQQAVNEINRKADRITFYTGIFMVSLILFGLYILYQIRLLGSELSELKICDKIREEDG